MCRNVCASVLLALMLFFGVPSLASAQNIIGTQSNYSGSKALMINPALISTSFLYFDAGLSFGVYSYNDLMYLKSRDFSKFLFSGYNSWSSYDWTMYNQYGVPHEFLYVRDTMPNSLTESIDLNILSMFINIDSRQSLALSLNNRVYSSVTNLPWEFGRIAIEGLDSLYFDRYSSEDIRIATMEWSELALGYSRTVYDRFLNKFDVGISLKGIIAYGGAVLNVNNLDYEILSKDNSNVYAIDADIHYAAPLNYSSQFSSNDVFMSDKLKNGLGFGVDFGFVYTKRKSVGMNRRSVSSCDMDPVLYRWRLGVSVTDIGFVKFKGNARSHHYFNDEPTLFIHSALDDVNSIDDLSKTLSAIYFHGDSLASVVGDEFTMTLPSSLNMQLDFNINDKFYVGAMWIQPFALSENSVRKAAQIVVSPRFENEYFDFILPVTLYDYSKMFLGAEMRLWFFSIGTQNILSFCGIGDFYGMDLYFSLKFNILKGRCLGSGRDACWNSDFR